MKAKRSIAETLEYGSTNSKSEEHKHGLEDGIEEAETAFSLIWLRRQHRLVVIANSTVNVNVTATASTTAIRCNGIALLESDPPLNLFYFKFLHFFNN